MRRKIGHEFTSGPFYYMHFCNCSRNPTTRAAGAEGIFSRWHCFPSLRISECPCVPQEPEARPGQDSPKGAAGALPPPGPEPQKEDRGGGGACTGPTESFAFSDMLPPSALSRSCAGGQQRKERKNNQQHRQRKSSPISFLAAPRPTDIKSNKPRSKTYERALLCRVPDNLLQSKALRNENQRYCSPVSTERLIRSSGKPVAKQSKSPCSARMPYLTEESQVTRITTSAGKFI